MSLCQHFYIHFYPEQLTEFSIKQASIKCSYAPASFNLNAPTHAYQVQSPYNDYFMKVGLIVIHIVGFLLLPQAINFKLSLMHAVQMYIDFRLGYLLSDSVHFFMRNIKILHHLCQCRTLCLNMQYMLIKRNLFIYLRTLEGFSFNSRNIISVQYIFVE